MKSKLQSIISAMIILLLFAANLLANNIVVSNIGFTGPNTTEKYVMVQFDLSWENSWRTNDLNGDGVTNWDAAWVFVKYRVGSDDWQHAWLSTTDNHHSVVNNNGVAATINIGTTTISSTDRGMGAFLYRTAVGEGDINWQNVQLRWNYGANGVADEATVDVRVFAIEMVHVPEASFYVGDGATGSDIFANFRDGGSNIPFQIISEGELTLGGTTAGNLANNNADGMLINLRDDFDNSTTQTLPSTFPKGYAAYYCMKYSITQQQYVDFLNSLTQTQATTRKHTDSRNRYAITGDAVGSYATTNPYVACSFLSWMDGAAYLDWAGLRPMTELEYEKASRGTATPVVNEFAWGTASVKPSGDIYTLNNQGLANEGIATGYNTTLGNANYALTLPSSPDNGPMRVGIFAANSNNTGRISAGASYYGIMELSGNLWEHAVTVGHANGRAFTGNHGDGALSTNGHANQTSWPGLSGGEVTSAAGSGQRGGNWNDIARHMRVSDRQFAGHFNSGIPRYLHYGFRGVRTAP